MTVQEAKEIIMQVPLYRYECELERGRQSDLFQALNVSIQAIEEVEQYRAFGTVEELKEALEKQIAKSPILEGDGYCQDGNIVYDAWYCPNCDKSYEADYDDYDYCPNCGQKIDWRDKP